LLKGIADAGGNSLRIKEEMRAAENEEVKVLLLLKGRCNGTDS
jgi:hypothetical protein